MKKFQVCRSLLLIAGLTGLSSAALAAESGNQTSIQRQMKSIDEDIERIDVVGQVPLSFYQLQAEKSELSFYDTLNSYVDNNDFKVSCNRRQKIGSHGKETKCYPQYFLNEMSQRTRDNLERGRLTAVLDKDIHTITRKKREESQKYIEELVEKHPELKAKLIDMATKQAKFQQQQAKLTD